jgi:ribulose-phosphate 3-epimerase
MNIYPSIICADPLNLEKELEILVENGVKTLHIDLMDGCFVPRYGFFPEILPIITQRFNLTFDVHCMVSNKELITNYLLELKNISNISLHLNDDINATCCLFDKIKSKRIKTTAVVDLYTPPELVSSITIGGYVDNIMYMGILPGILKQRSSAQRLLNKINLISNKIGDHFVNGCRSVDGGVNFTTLQALLDVGINTFVCGSQTVYKDCNLEMAFDERKTIIKRNIEKMTKILSQNV